MWIRVLSTFWKKMVGDTQKLGFLFPTLFVSNHNNFIFLTMFVYHITHKTGENPGWIFISLSLTHVHLWRTPGKRPGWIFISYEARFCKKMVGDTHKLGFLFPTLFVSNHSDFVFLTMFVHHITIKLGKTLDEYSYHWAWPMYISGSVCMTRP